MYDIWVNKEVVHSVPNDKLIFNILSKNQKSNVKTDVEMLWRRFGKLYVSDIIEDLLIIGISVFSVDKRLSRRISEDNWSRSINVHVPVIELEKWLSVKAELEELLSFLSGDHWTFHFRKSKEKLRGNKLNNRYELIDGSQFDCVSLFSGGLDSFAG
ncbi:recombinase family protein [Thermicanus aegyptius]|uniref:recombinase family protein n=1 Tax=Thermicanus aegyptius TaxID=94009 RepID=UPI000423B9B2|nr:recombinase family protein [Thermicanus aegyptius]